jgi:predicted GNAT family N-acyltransferase
MEPRKARPGNAKMRFVNDLSDAQLRQLHALYRDEWWTKERSLEQTAACVAGAGFFIAALEADELIGSARVLTDFVYKALIVDVVVAKAHRRAGVGHALMAAILADDRLARVEQFDLCCLPELKPFYASLGFSTDVDGVVLMRFNAAAKRRDRRTQRSPDDSTSKHP